MLTFVLWCILFVLCWPLALLALALYPIVWLILLPFRLVGIAVGGALDLVAAIITLPARMLRSPRRAQSRRLSSVRARQPIRESHARQSKSCAG